ncbi:MAG TPA: GerMN domain-containing protein [Firmicutes bacterium]|nr:GerMN domain-containing protein [Bacillota bacterium]
MGQKAARVFLVFFIIGIGLGIAGGWFDKEAAPPPVEQARESPAPKVVPQQESSGSPQDEGESLFITLYFSDGEAMYLRPELRVVDDPDADRAALVIGELIRGPQRKGLVRTVPPTVSLRKVWVEDGVAYVDFSREFQTEHWGGSAGDTFTLFSVVNSLTELPGIEAVQFLIEGEIEEAVLGHTDTTAPIRRREDLIGPE